MPALDQALKIRRGASTSRDAAEAARELHAQIGQDGASLGLFYCSPEYDLDRLGAELRARFGSAPLIGCTTAGEITPQGYLDGSLTGITIASPEFEVVTERLDHLDHYTLADGEAVANRLLAALRSRGKAPSGQNTFGFLLIDGLSNAEEAVVSSLHGQLGDIQLFGGSAADGTDFGRAFIYHDGAFRSGAALFTVVHTNLPFEVFKTQHFVPTDAKMVVTGADVATRTVYEINGLPAGREYARLVGMEVEQLTELIFAAHPVVVRLGGNDFVRSIMKVNEDESLTFACAIDNGIVLTVARGVDMIENMREAFEDVRSRVGDPQVVFGCDCLFRLIETDQKGIRDEIGKIMLENNVIGFSTYGEQFNGMHVNQTFTGVAIGSPR
ncbi:MAG: FIST C-terminal domain-containing protein [Gemmatimonadota bacterium]|nr:FIST C-terminal domain-containing protein [Gemmatimonadota bacterium]